MWREWAYRIFVVLFGGVLPTFLLALALFIH